jgi:hypothetical protein
MTLNATIAEEVGNNIVTHWAGRLIGPSQFVQMAA